MHFKVEYAKYFNKRGERLTHCINKRCYKRTRHMVTLECYPVGNDIQVSLRVANREANETADRWR